jgi:hypothetical protein
MVVSPTSAHAFGISMIRHGIAEIGEHLVAYRTFAALLPDLSVQQLPHFGRRMQFAISPRMVSIFDPLNAKAPSTFFSSFSRPQQERER